MSQIGLEDPQRDLEFKLSMNDTAFAHGIPIHLVTQGFKTTQTTSDQAYLGLLVRDGLLTQQNQRRWASYRVAEDSPQSEVDSLQLAGDSPQSAPHLTTDSPRKVVDSPPWPAELLSLAEPARLKAKLPAAEMQAVVLSLCASRWLTTKDLATLLRRDPENLQGRILAGLVKKGLLELRFPDVPNRPDQAYRAVAMTVH